jgi:hypothetical protein
MTDEPAIKHRFVFVSDDGNDRQEFVIDPGETAFFYPKQTAMYTLYPGEERFAMVAHSSHIVINSPDKTPDIWGNPVIEVDAEIIEQ